MFQIEPRVPVRLLVDISGSMLTGSAANSPTKFSYARRLAAALVYVGLVRLDSMLLQPFSSGLLDPFVASGGRHRFQPAEIYLRSLEAHGQTNYFETARRYLDSYPQRGLTVIISDFLDDVDCLRPLQYIADFGHELLLIKLWGGEDREPSDEGDLELVDAERETHLHISLDQAARESYTEAFDRHSEEIRKLALRNGGRYMGLSTDVSLADALFGSLGTSLNQRGPVALSSSAAARGKAF